MHACGNYVQTAPMRVAVAGYDGMGLIPEAIAFAVSCDFKHPFNRERRLACKAAKAERREERQARREERRAARAAGSGAPSTLGTFSWTPVIIGGAAIAVFAFWWMRRKAA